MNDTAQERTYAISKEQIAFLRSPKLRSLVFRHYVDTQSASSGWELNKPWRVEIDAKHEDGIEVCTEIRLNGGRVADYTKEKKRQYRQLCLVVLVYPANPSPVKTMIDFLKPGDVLELEWVLGNDNQYIERTGEGGGERLYHDTLYCNVKRGEGAKQKVYKFWIDDSICADNSARMCNAQ